MEKTIKIRLIFELGIVKNPEITTSYHYRLKTNKCLAYKCTLIDSAPQVPSICLNQTMPI